MSLDFEHIVAMQQASLQVIGIGVGYPGDLRFQIAFAGGLNERFTNAFHKEIEPYVTAIAADALTEETARRILSRVYVQGVILAWECDDPNNQPPPLEEIDAAARWLRDDTVMFEDIEGIATDMSNFCSKVDENG